MNAHRFSALWPLQRGISFLNHGSYGSCPREVLRWQSRLRRQMEQQPVAFLGREFESRLDAARLALAGFVGAAPDDLVLVPNATAGVNTVLRSLKLRAGDELLITDHAYNACRNALDFVARESRARVVVARIPFPLRDADEAIGALLRATSSRTRLALIDHITSPTAMVLPIAAMVRELKSRGIDTLVDGAHAPGMVPLDISALGASYYSGNCHKWLCAPKGAGFLWVRTDLQRTLRPLAISHGANDPRRDRSRFQLEFGWSGTLDPTAMLCIPHAIETMAALLPGGWPALMRRNHDLALRARSVLCAALGIEPPCPETMIGSMVALPLPDHGAAVAPNKRPRPGVLQAELWRRWKIEVPVIPWPTSSRAVLRISAQVYNNVSQFRRLGRALEELGVGHPIQ